MSDIIVDFSTYLSDTGSGPYNAADNVTLADTSSILDALTDAQIDSLATNNVDTISATDGVLSWNADQFSHFILGNVAIDPDTFAILADTGADISALTATQIGEIAAKGVATIDPTDSMLTFSVDQFTALGAMSVDASADFTIADTGAHLAGMSAGAIAALGSLGVDHLDATDNVLSLNLAQYQALGTVTLTAGDDVTLADTSAHLQTLTASDLGDLGGNGIDQIDATDNVLTISLSAFNALGSVTLTQSDVVTLADTHATISSLSTGNIAALAAGGIDILDATDNAISFTVAQYNETVADHIALTAGDTVTLVDSGPTLSLLTAADINNLVNVDAVNATDNTLVIAVDQFEAFVGKNITLGADDAVTISDTAANLGTLDFSTLAAANVDQLNSTTAFTNLTVANLAALGTVIFSGASSVTLTDTGAHIATVTDFSTFAAHGVDTLDASDDTLTISEAQFQALGTTHLTGSDTVTISDTATNIIFGPNYATLAGAGIDFLNATTAIIVIVNDITNLGTVAFTAGSDVTLKDTGAHIAAVANFATFAAHGVDRIDASNNTLTISATQYGALGTVTLTAGDTITISDTAAHLGGLTFADLAAANIDLLNSTTAYTTLTVQNMTDLGAVHFTAASNVTLTDSASNIQGVSDFTTFATHGVDTIKSSDNQLTLTVSEFTGLGTTHLTGSDAIYLEDTATNLTAYLDSAGTQTALSTNGVDLIYATGGSMTVTAAEFSVVYGAGAVFSGPVSVTMVDTGANIAALDFTTLAAMGIDRIDASDNALTVTVAQYLDVAGGVAFTAADTVTIADTAAHVEAMTAGQIAALHTYLIDAVSVTSGGDLDWSVAQWQAFPVGVSLSDTGGALVVDDSETTIEGLTGTQLGALATSGAQELAPTEGVLNLSVSQAEGFLGTGLSIVLGDAATLSDAGSAIAGLTATQIGQLAAAGFDTIDASDNTLTFSVAQFSALGTVTLAGADAVTLADTADNLNTYLHGDVFGALFSNGVNTIHATEGAISIDVQVVNNVANSGAAFASGDTVTLFDTGANIAAQPFFSALPGLHVDTIDASDNVLNLTLAQYEAIAGTVALTVGDNVTVTGNLDHLSTAEIAGFATYNVDHLLDDDGSNAVVWSAAQWNALTTAVTIDNVAHQAHQNSVYDTAANLSAVTAVQIADFVAEGAERWQASDPAQVTWDVAKLEAMGATSWGGTVVHISDTASNLQAVSDYSIFAAHGIAAIDSTDALSLTVAQFSDLGTTILTGAEVVTLADTASNLSTYLDSGAAHAALSTNGVDFIHATGGTLTVDAQAISNVTGTGAVFTPGDTVTLADTGANIAALDFSTLHALNVDTIDASDGVLNISLTQYEAIAGVVALTVADNVTVTGNLDGLSTAEIASFHTNNVDHLLDNDGNGTVLWSVAQWNALTPAVTIDNAGHIAHSNYVLDTAADLNAVTATQIANFVTEGAQLWSSSDFNAVTWDVAKLEAMGASTFYFSGPLYISDTAANLEAISDYSIFSAHNVDTIFCTDPGLSLTLAQFEGLNGIFVDSSTALTLADTANNLAAYLDGTSAHGALSLYGVDFIHASEGTWSLDAQAIFNVAGTGAVFASGDTVTLADTGDNIAALDFSVLPALNVDTIDASDNTLSISLTQYEAIAGTVALTGADDVTVTGSLNFLSTAEIASFATNQVDHLLNNSNVIWTVAQWNALTTAVTIDTVVHLPNGNYVLDSGANLSTLTAAQIADFVTEGAEVWYSADPGFVFWNVANLEAMGTSRFDPSTTSVIADTAFDLEAVSDYSIFASHGISVISASGGSLLLTVAQFAGLGVTAVDGSNTLTLADTADNLSAYLDGAGVSTALSANGVDFIHATGGTLSVDAQAISNVNGTGAVFTPGDIVTLSDTGAHIAALDFSVLHTLNVDTIDATDNVLSISLTQYEAVAGTVAFTAADTVTIAATAADVEALTAGQIGALSTNLIDAVSVTSGGDLDWSVAQWQALPVSVSVSDSGGVLVVDDSEATLEGLTGTQLGALATSGAQELASTDGTLNFNVSQAEGFLGTGLAIALGDAGTLVDAGSVVAGMTVAQISQLAAAGFDKIDTGDNSLTLDTAQFSALGTVLVANGDTLTLADTAANLSTYLDSGAAHFALTANGVDFIHATGGTLSVHAQAISNVTGTGAVFASGDTVILADTGANIATLDFSVLHGLNVDTIDASDNVLSISLTQYEAIAGTVALTVGDNVTVTGNLDHLSTAEIATFATNHVDHLLDNGNQVIWTAAQWNALTTAVTIDNTSHSQSDLVSDSAANISALTATQIANFVTEGAEVWTTTDSGTVTWDVAKFEAIGPTFFDRFDVLDISDTAAHLEAVSDFSNFAYNGVDKISSTDSVLSLTVAQFESLHGAFADTIVDNANTLTLADTASNLSAYLDGAGVSAALSANGVDFIHATEGTWSVDAQAISNVAGTGAVFTPGDTVTLSDTGANIAALDFSPLHGLNVDTIDATDNVLNISLTQYEAIAGTVALTVADNVTVTGNLDSLSAAEIASFAANHVDHLLDNDGFVEVLWTVAQWDALTTAVTIDNIAHEANTNIVYDTAANLSAATAAQIANFVTEGAETWYATDHNTVTWNVAQLEAMGATFWNAGATTVVISDTAANLELVSDYSIFANHGVTTISASDTNLSLTADQFRGLGNVSVDSANTFTLADTAANIQAMGSHGYAAMAGKGVDFIHATDGNLTVTDAELNAILSSTTAFTAADHVTLTGSQAELFDSQSAAFFTALGTQFHIDEISLTGGSGHLDVGQWNGLVAGSVSLDSANTIALMDTAATLAGESAGAIAAMAGQIDSWAVSDSNTLALSEAQLDALSTATVALTQSDTVELVDTESNIEALFASALAAYIAQGVDIIHATGGTLNVNVSQVEAVIATTATFFGGDNVTLLSSSGLLSGLAVSDIAKLAAANVDHVFTTDILYWSKAQFDALGTVTITSAASGIYLVDSEATLEALTVSDIAHYASLEIGHFIVTGQSDLNYSVAQALQIAASGIQLQSQFSGGVFSVVDTGTSIDALTAAQIATLPGSEFSQIDSTSGSIHWSEAQFNALSGDLTLHAVAGSQVVLFDTQANLDALTASQIAAYGTSGATEIESSTTFLHLNLSQLDALATAAIALTPGDTVLLFDSESNIEALSAAALKGYVDQGVTLVAVMGGTLNLTAAQVAAVLDNGASFVAGDTVTLSDTASNIEVLTASQWGELVAGHVDAVTATGGTLDITVAEFQAVEAALHSGSLTLTNPAHLSDTGTAISGLTPTEIGQLAGDNIGTISATGDINFSQAQIDALGSVSVSASGRYVLADTEANIEGLSTSTIDADALAGVTRIHSTDASNTLHFTVAQAQHMLGDGLAVLNGVVTVTDTGANISGLSSDQIVSLSAYGFTQINDTSGTITWSVSQLDNLLVALTLNGNGLVLSDAEATLEAQNAAKWANISTQVTSITANDTHILNLNISQISQIFGSSATFATGDTVTLTDTTTNINALTVSQIGQLSTVHVDAINSSDDSVTWTVAQFGALNGVTLTAGDNVTINDTAANLLTLNFSTLAAANVDAIDATDGALTLTAAQYTALGTVGLTATDTVTISDTAAHITTLDFSLLAAHNVDFLDVTDAFSLNVARYQSMGALKFAPADTITLADTGANIAAMSAAQFAALAGNGIDKIDATDNVLSLTIGRYNVLGTVTLTASDVVTLADTGAHIAALTVAQIGALAAGGIDKIDATDNAFSLSVAQYQALGTVTLTAADTVTLADTGAHIQALTAAQIGALAGGGIDVIHSTSTVLSLSVAQYGVLGTVTLTGTDSVTLLDTGANLQTLNFATLASKNVDILDASDNVLTLTAAQFQALGTVSLKSSDTVTLLDTGADISALTVGQFNALASKGIDVLDATDNVYSLSAAQVNGLGALKLAANDAVTMSDTEANIESETSGNFTTAATAGIDFIHSTSNIDHITVAQVTPLLGTATAFVAGDAVTLIDTGAHIATLTATQIGQLAAAGVDKIDATDDMVSLSVAQYRALGTVTLASGDTNTISDNDTNIDSLTTGELAGLAAAHVGAIHSSFTVVWSAAQWNALPGSVHVSSVFGASGVELIGSADVIDALTAAQISSYAAEGLGALQGFNGDLTLSVSQATTILANLIIVGNDDGIFLTDTGSAIAGLSTTQIGELAGAGFQTIDATDDALTLSVAQFQVLNGVALTAGDTVTVADTEANIEALSNAQLSAMRDGSVDIIHSTGGVLNVSTAQAGALLGSGTHFAYGDAVTLLDSGATISTLAPVQFSVLAAAGIDTIDASDNSLTLSLGQYRALGTVTLTQSDTVTIQDDNSGLTVMTEAEIQSLSSKGIDVLESFNGNFSFSLGQAEALFHQTGGGHVSLTAADTFFVNDTGADISTLSATDLAALGALGAGAVDLIGSGTITFSIAQYEAAVTAGVLIDSSDNVTLFDTGAALGGLTAAQIGALAGNGVDHIDVSDDAVTWSLAQVNALGTVTLTSADTYTVSDTEANIEALSNTQFSALISKGIDVFHSQSGSLSLSESQVAVILGGARLDSANSVTLSDTGGHIAAFSAAQIATLAGVGVDFIDASDNTLTLSVAQYQALGTVQLSAGDANTLSDTSAAFQGLSATDIAGLDNQYISHLHSSDGVQWSLAQWNALASGITIDTSAGGVALYDTEAHDESLTVAQINNFHTAGLNSIVVTDTSTLDFTVAQTTAILNDGIVLSTRTGVVADTRANLAALTVVQIGELAAAGFRAIDSTNDLVNFNRAQVDALKAGHIALTLGDTVDMNVNEAQMEAFTAATFTAYMTQGVDIFQSASSILAVNESQVVAVMSGGGSFRDGDAVTLADTASHIQSLKATEFGQLATTGVDIIDVTSGTLSLSVADYLALGPFTIVGGSVSLADTSTNIDALTADQFAALAGTSISHIDASDNTLSLSVADVRGVLTQTNGGTVTFDATDALTVADTGANLGVLTAADLASFAGAGAASVTLDASDGVLTISLSQYNAIAGNSIALTATDTVTLADTGASLAALSAAQLAALATHNVDIIDATDDAITLSISQLDALHTANVALTPADTVTLFDTEANIEALSGSQLAGYVTQGVDIFDGNNDILHLSASQIASVLATSAAFAAENVVTLVDSGANIAALSAVQFGQLASHGVDHIDAADNVLALTAAQYSGLGGTTTLTGADTVTLFDTGAHIAALTAAQFVDFAANGIDTIDASDNVLSLSVAQYQGLGTVTLTGTDVVTLADTGAHIFALTAAQIGQLATNGIDTIDTTNNVLSLNLSQFNALGTVTLTNADSVTLADTGATLAAMTAAQFAALAGKGIDKIDATDNVLSLTIGRYNALGTVALTASDTVTLADTGAHLGALTAAQIGALASRGIDAIDATDNAITFSLAQYNALGSVHTAANDVITVNGTSGDDLISGTANSDVLIGGNGDDVLVGQGGNDTLSGGAGNNMLSGGTGTDTVDYSWSAGGVTVDLLNGTANNGTGTDTLTSIENVTGSGGNDTITAGTGVNALLGGNGDDTFVFGPYLTAADHVDGGAGNDTVTLNGDYSAGVTFTATTMVNVETLTLAAGHSYTLATVDATVAPGATMTVDGSALGSLDVLNFTGTHETDGNYIVTGGAAADHISTGSGNDTINGGAGDDVLAPGSGNDTVNAGDGNDIIFMYANLTAADHIDGGAGLDRVRFNGDYSGGVVLGATTITNVETFSFDTGFNYKITTNDATVASGQVLTVDATALGVGNQLTFNGSAETDGTFNITGGLGGDDLTGGAGADHFIYTSAAQSSSIHYDTIHNLDFSMDRIDVTGSITAIDATVTSGSLSTATFDSDLASDMSGHLGVHHALMFTASSGTLAGDTFLVIDINGVAGYQAGQDIVIELAGHTGSLAVGDFI